MKERAVQAKSVPAAAVIQNVRALFIMTGRKGYVGGLKSFTTNARVVTLEVGF